MCQRTTGNITERLYSIYLRYISFISFCRGMGGPQSPFLSSMNCYGSENSIFMCRNPGWKKSIPAECSLPNRNAGVFCYNHGKLIHYLTIAGEGRSICVNIMSTHYLTITGEGQSILSY